MFKDRGRLAVQVLLGVLLIAGFAIGRLTGPGESARAFSEENKLKDVASPVPAVSPAVSADEQAFYLSDFKTGYSDGYNNGLTGDGVGTMGTARVGYNEGFKQGFAEGYQTRVEDPAKIASTNTVIAVPDRQRVVYRSVERPTLERRRRNSTLKTVLTIAAPAAIGAGVGGAFGGGKGAGVGALLGGGGGALYHLIKNK